MLQLAYYNLEIDWRTGEVQITRCSDECKNKWRTRSTKPEWQKQKEKEEKKKKKQRKKKKEFRKLIVEEEMKIARMIKEKEEEEKNLIEIRMVEEIVLRRFHKYLKIFEKKESEMMLTRKTWDHAIDLREEFILKKGKIYLLSRIEREKVQKFVKDQLRKGYI